MSEPTGSVSNMYENDVEKNESREGVEHKQVQKQEFNLLNPSKSFQLKIIYILSNKLSKTSELSTLSLSLRSSLFGVPSGLDSTLGFVAEFESPASIRS